MRLLIIILLATILHAQSAVSLDTYVAYSSSTKWVGAGAGFSTLRSGFGLSGDVAFAQPDKFMGADGNTKLVGTLNITFQMFDNMFGPVLGYAWVNNYDNLSYGLSYGFVLTPWHFRPGLYLTLKMISYAPNDDIYKHDVFIGIGFRFARTNSDNWGYYDKDYKHK